MTTCRHTHQTLIDGQWVCNDCDNLAINRGRRPLTEWERLKLSFYRDERRWQDHIRSRKIVNKNGQKMIVAGNSIMPER